MGGPILEQLGLILVGLPQQRVVGLAGVRVDVVLRHGLEVQLRVAVIVAGAAKLGGDLQVGVVAGHGLLAELGQGRVLAVLVGGEAAQILRAGGATGVGGRGVDAFRRIHPVDELGQTGLVLGLGADGHDGGAITVRLEAVGIDLHVLKRSQHEADAFGLVLVGVHTRLAQPAPDGQHGLAVGDLGPHGIPVLGGGIRIDQPHGFGLVQELQDLLVDAALLGGGLHVLTVGGDEHGTLVGVAEPAADGCGVLHHIAVPILEQ